MLLGEDAVRPGDGREYLSDATESRNLRGHAEAIALPGSAEEVAAVMRWCYDHDVPLVPRGGGTGLTGGAVPVDGGIVLGLERLATLDVLEPGALARSRAGRLPHRRPAPARARERSVLSA